MKRFTTYVVSIILVLLWVRGYSQGEPVRWEYRVEPSMQADVCVSFIATLATGWHIYSQFLEAGGPIPTTFEFKPDDAYAVEGAMEEIGKLIVYHDDIYDMQIKYYKGQVTFRQQVNLKHPTARLTGSIQYMVCDTERCVPLHHAFSVPLEVKGH